MGKITEIKSQKRQGCFNIYIDRKYAFGIDSLTLVKRGLKVGLELSEEDKEKSLAEGTFQINFDKTLRFLGFRPRSIKEVRDYLARLDLEPKEQKRILEKVEAMGLVDDRKFAEWWIGQRITFRPKGWTVLKMELRRKGIGEKIIEGLKELAGGEEERAYGLLKANWPKWAGETDERRKEKAVGFLMRRGFGWETARRVIDRVRRDGVQ